MSKTALITGAADGIGKAAALRLAKEGYNIALHIHRDKSMDRAVETVRECKISGAPDTCILTGDLSDKKKCEEAVYETAERIGGPDILINNAGLVRFLPLDKTSEEIFRLVMGSCFDSTFFMTQAAVPYMKKKKWGRIINITSLSSKTGVRGLTAYTAAKGAAESFSRSAALELAQYGITVNCISPGFVMTSWAKQMTEATIKAREAEIPLGRFASPDDIAAAAAFFASEDSSYITGKTLEVTGGLQ
ncbi:SDR family oxidoreductase [Ruminococcus sp.]|uniref:SDR family NAD(P)-dependent oxidoreductase n=1 Tax=Ruminococcus sp. TaxID=41978 RepID=UPI0025D2A982|nr:SDR family oxidoreductase [Ruminococcus sp.]MCR4639215.1 SDR family oxidoreductase [Ruminococcus sp.]